MTNEYLKDDIFTSGMIFEEEPKGFKAQYEVAGCFIEYDGQILLLHRQDNILEGNTWGLPAGRIEPGENSEEAMIREIKEETGISIEVTYFKKIYAKFPLFNIIFHIFHTRINEKPKVVLDNNEHKDFQWISPKDALNLSLIMGLDECIRFYYKI